MRGLVVPIVCWLGCGGPTNPEGGGLEDAAIAADADTREATFLDQIYRTVDGHALGVDIHIPAGAGPFPTVALVHGGGFVAGDKTSDDIVAWAAHLATHGFATIAINYRLDGDFAPSVPVFPGPVQDIKCALQWLRADATRFRVDSDRIYALGGSAGGYFVNLLGATGDDPALDPGCGGSDKVSGVVSFYGPSDWAVLADDPARASGLGDTEERFVGSPCTSVGDRAGICAAASPTKQLDAGDPPYFVLHSVDDPTVPIGQSRALVARLTALGAMVESREVAAQGHGWAARFGNPEVAGLRDQITDWLLARAE